MFYVLRAAAFDSGSGYPHAEEILPFAVPFALPLLVGAFVVNIKKGWGRYVRWLCAVLLLPQAAVLFYVTFSYVMLVALPPLLGALLLLRMEMAWSFNQVRSLIPLGVRLKLVQLRLLLALVGMGISGILLGHHWTHNSLEPDTQMIAHFKAHREDFEYLVNSFRALPEEASVYGESGWNGSPEIQAIKKRSDIQYVNQGELILPPEQRTRANFKEGKVKIHKNTVLDFILENQKSSNSSLHYCLEMTKGYVNFPIAPSLEQGQLLFPWEKGKIPGQEKPRRVADSLDGYPPGLKEQGYVYRHIEANWFIELHGSCK